MKTNLAKKNIFILLTILIFSLALSGCGKEDQSQDSSAKDEKIISGSLERNVLEDESVKYFTENSGIPQNQITPANVERQKFPSINVMLMELNAGNIDYFRAPLSTGQYLIAKDNKLALVEGNVKQHYHMVTRAEDEQVNKKLSNAISTLKSNGTLDGLIEEYITNSVSDPEVADPPKTSNGETYTIAVTGDFPPMDYVSADGKPAGFNVAFINALAEKTGYNFKIVQLDANARLTALASKKIDIVFWNSCFTTNDYEPTNDNLLLTSVYFEEPNCWITKDFPAKKIEEIYGSN